MQFNSRAHCSLNICWCSPNLQCLRVFKTCEFFVDQWNFSYYCYFVSLNLWFRYPCVLVCRFVFYRSALFRNNDFTSRQMNASQAWSFLSISRELGNTWYLKWKGWITLIKTEHSYLVRCLVAVRFRAPHEISVVSDLAMSKVLGRIEPTSTTMTAGTPTKLKYLIISLVDAYNDWFSIVWHEGVCVRSS